VIDGSAFGATPNIRSAGESVPGVLDRSERLT
jgi:hypothetical protein